MTGAPGRAVVLIGPPGAGKTTVGQRLAKLLRVPFVDTDELIVERTGLAIADIFASAGEAEFRRIEAEVVAEVIEREAIVASLGGGAVMTEATRAALTKRVATGLHVAYLELTLEEGIARTIERPRERGAANPRPLLAGSDAETKYRELLAARGPVYRELATIRVSTVGRGPNVVVRQIARRMRDTNPAPTRRSPWPKFPAPRLPGPRIPGRHPRQTHQNSTNQNSVSQKLTDQKPAGQKPAGQKPAGQKPAGQKPAGQKPAGQPKPVDPQPRAPKPGPRPGGSHD